MLVYLERSSRYKVKLKCELSFLWFEHFIYTTNLITLFILYIQEEIAKSSYLQEWRKDKREKKLLERDRKREFNEEREKKKSREKIYRSQNL